MSDSPRYTVEEVLNVLRSIYPDCTPESGGSFDTLLLTDWEGSELLWSARRLFFRLDTSYFEKIFGFTATKDDRQALSRMDATIGDLAALIAARAPRRPIPARPILGRHCNQADLFGMLEEATAEIVGTDVRVGPSTRLHQTMNKTQLTQLAIRLLLYFPLLHEVPDLWYRSWIESGVLRLIGLAAAIALPVVMLSGVCDAERSGLVTVLAGLASYCGLLMIAVVIVAAPVLILMRWLVGGNTGPFSSRIKTYRDLTEILARQEWIRYQQPDESGATT